MNSYNACHLIVLFTFMGLVSCEAFASSPFGIRHRGGASSSASSFELGVLKEPERVVSHNGSSGGRNTNNDNNKKKTEKKNSNNFIPVSHLESNHRPPPPAALVVEYVAETKLPTDLGPFQLRAYRVPDRPGLEPCVIYSRSRPIDQSSTASVRIHDQCLTSEVFRSQRCDCKEQLYMALQYIQENGGCIIYLQQEGRGIGLANKIAAYELQDGGLDTVDANLHLGFPEDAREYTVIPAILKDLGICTVELMTNNPRKVDMLTELGVNVQNTIPMVVPEANPHNRDYLVTKKDRMNHQNLSGMLGVPRKGRRRYPPPQFITNGTDMTVNAVQVSLSMLENQEMEEQGVTAADDGYCFGRQSVVDAIQAMADGEMVVVVDDMDRENEGDFIMAAEQCRPEDMAQIVRYSSGVVCVALEDSRMKELEIPPMVVNNEDPKGTAFGVSVDARTDTTTGISAQDRARTVRLLANPDSKADDFFRPGHIFPLRAREGGVLTRDGHTEAAVDLSRMAGLAPAGLLCEIVSEDNPTEMMRLPELKRFCKRHGYVMTSIVDIAQYRRETES